MLAFACAILMALLVWRGLALQRAGLSLHFDEAQYWVWSTGLDWGYYSKPPVIAWIYRAAGLMLGHDAWGFRLTSGLLYALSAGVVGLIARDSFGSRVGVPAALAFASIPGIAVSAGFLTTDAPLVLCWALALLTLQRACGTQGHLGHWLGLGVATGIGLMSKYTMGAVAISALGWLLSRPEGRAQFRRAGPWCALVIAVLLFAPNLLWNAHNGFPTLGHTQEISQLDRAGLHPMRLLEFVLGQWVVGGPLLVLFGLLMAWTQAPAQPAIRPAAETNAIALHQWFALPLLLIACVEATLSRAQLNWALPAYVSLTILIVAFMLRRGWGQRLSMALAINLLILSGFLHWPVLREAIGLQSGAKGDLFARFYGWPAFAQRLKAKLDPDMMLVNDERSSMALLAYELRLPIDRIASWNPEGRRADHWSRFVDLADVADQPRGNGIHADPTKRRYLVVSATLDESILLASFESVVRQADDRGPGCEACATPWKVWIAQGFRGYAPLQPRATP